MKKVICTLDKELNECPYYKADDQSCHSENPCSFSRSDEEHSPKTGQYIREERWYEKYYKK